MRRYRDRRKAIIETLEVARRQRKVSQRALSERLGEHHNYINEIAHGQHRVTLEEFIEICEALEVSPHDLLSKILRP
jgi:DNA-binding Xre family transcriptional regulator